MRHQRLLGRLGFRFNGFASAMLPVTLAALALSDLTLLGRAVDESDAEDGSVEASPRGAEVGAEVGGRLGELVEREEPDRMEREECRGAAGIEDGRSSRPGRFAEERCGLCAAEGMGLPCML